jgi:uncharacterized protein (DUF1499 family)
MSAQTFPSLNPPLWPVKLTHAGLWTIVAGLVLVALSGPLNRLAMVGFGAALLMLAVGALLLFLGALTGSAGMLVAAVRKLPMARAPAAVGLVVALLVLGYLVSWLGRAFDAPPIHEVSTDLADPPPFVAVREIRDRTAGLNPSAYTARIEGRSGAIDVPAMQLQHYPDLQTLALPETPERATERARAVAEALGWEVVAYVPQEGRLEATATTRFFGFRDDVVVRARPADDGSTLLDVRSKSRVGLGDAGANAARVRAFLDGMRAG